MFYNVFKDNFDRLFNTAFNVVFNMCVFFHTLLFCRRENVGILARRRTTSPRTFTLLLRHIYIIVIVVKSVREK